MPRPHYGQGDFSLEPARSVFLNCPFDPVYRNLFDALVFSIVCSGFRPRCAIDTGSVRVPRMERIYEAIFASKYSIHDLSRCRGEGDANLARFNMPLELGMAMARGYLSRDTGVDHDWLVLVPSDHAYARFASDLAGFDLKRYDGEVEGLVPHVVSWLATREDAIEPVTPNDVLNQFPIFLERLNRLRNLWRGEPPWVDIVATAIDIAGPASGD